MRAFAWILVLVFLMVPPGFSQRTNDAASDRASDASADGEVVITPPDAASATRSAALELAGAFANDGYKVRDGYWMEELKPDQPATLEVNLFRGNEYWFCAAVHPPGRKLNVSVLDEAGRIVDHQTYTDAARAAAGFEPDISGKYFIRVTLAEGEAAPFTLVYCYK